MSGDRQSKPSRGRSLKYIGVRDDQIEPPITALTNTLYTLPPHAINIHFTHVAECIMTRRASLLSTFALTMLCRTLIVVVYDMNLDIPHRVMKRDELVFEIVFAPLLEDTSAAEIVIWAHNIQTLESDTFDWLRANVAVRGMHGLL